MNTDIGNRGKKFSSTYQPTNRRKSTKFLTELLTKQLSKKNEIIIEGKDIETGELRKVRITNPNKETIVMALLRKAAKGDVAAMREVFDRIEGKPVFTAEIELPGVDYIGFKNDV